MKRLLTFITFCCAMIGGQANTIQSVDMQTFQHIIKDSTVVIVDVRTAPEYEQGHIPNAILIDVKQADFLQQVAQKLNKKQTIALYCRSGRRSKHAAQLLLQHGYKVIELNAGFISWTGPVER